MANTMQMALKGGKMKVLTLSYDDGVIQDKRLVGILDKHGIKCTFNINTGLYYKGDTDPERGRMTHKSTVELFKNSPHEVAVHAYTHPHLELVDSANIIAEIIEDRKNIEKDYGVITRGMAYPFGTYNVNVVETLEKCGIVYSRTVYSKHNFQFPENWLTLHPTCHHKDPRLMELAKWFVEKPTEMCRNPEMFYLWGHSYEFDDDDNWNVIEEFCDYAGGKVDIWYATNIEVYDYVKAYEALQSSFEKDMIYNPSTIDVWIKLNGKIMCVKAGETLYL